MNRSHPPIFDLQINGWRGVDFNADQLSADQLHQVCLDLAERGVQRFLATLITDELPLMLQRIRRLNHLAATDPLAGKLIAGIHLEGPFLNPEPGYIGAHRPECALPASPETAAQLFDAAAGMLKLVTLAPETDRGGLTIRWLRDRNVRIAAGHCNPSLDQLKAALDSGLSLFTHLGNACPATLPRHDNIIQRVLSLSDKLDITLIADGQHIPYFALGNYLRAIGPDRAILVSDVTAAGGLPPGPFAINGRPVHIDAQGIARLPDQPQLLAGSTCLLDTAISLLKQHLDLSDDWIHRLTWTNPRRALGEPVNESNHAPR